MPDASDMELLRDYDQNGSETAFAELVQRHIGLVYSVALRQVGVAAHAEEVTQVVFIILARKAGQLRPNTVLEGWLHETARLTALSFVRGERRRQFREQEAYMQSTLNETTAADAVWHQLAPLLDEAMSRLGRKDRDAVILRFFKEKSVREVAAALRTSEAAAQRRVLRALEKLHHFFTRRGVSSTTAILAGEISAHSVQAAPVALAKTVTAVALAKGAATSISTLTLIEGALKIMAWTKAKTAVVVCVVVAVTATTGVVGYKLVNARPVLQSSAIDDIQPDGTIRSQVTSEMINYLGETLTTNSFQDAILHIDRITDALGQPIKFATRRDGGLWRYEETYNRPIPPGGKIVETVEGTETGLVKSSGEPGEYQYQIDITTGYEGNTHRVQVVDLPAGAILLEKQPANAVGMTNNGRIELRVDKIIPPGGDLPIRYRYRLPTNAH